jgi:hypothetical protein
MKKYLLLFLLLTAIEGFGQTRMSDHNTIGWFSASVSKPINKKFNVQVEYQWRRVKFLKDWQQSILRGGIGYKINPKLSAFVGYGWIETFPYGEYFVASIAKRFPEHRLYEQFTLTDNIGRSTISHRLRIEQRWIGRYTNINSTEPDQTVYVNRVRYMPKIEIPLSSKCYASLFDELMIGFGKNVGENVFDQNRVGILLGIKPTSTFKIEAGFINQTLQFGREINGKNVFQYNNGLMVNTIINLK